MIKIDWEVFKAKFSTNPQDAFEWMCYLLFCNEFRVKTGIFRYKNQSAIETNPISQDGINVGWQAKFYEVALSNHKNDILETITKAKRDYPDLNKIIFYTNSEWGQNKGKEPKGKIEAEEKAKENNLEIEWRCCSFFESPFVVDDCSRIASYFFTQSDNLFALLSSFESHTDAILDDIETTITFGDENVSINRFNLISEIKSSNSSALIISGEGGTGKTALIKELYGDKGRNDAFYVHKATEFSVSSLKEFLSGVFIKDFVEAHDGAGNKTVVIDSAEHLLTLENTDPIKEYLSTLIKSGWKVWFTTRNNYLDDLIFQLYEVYKTSFNSIHIEKLDDDTLFELAKKHGFIIPDDKKFKELILTPFYLREYLKYYQDNKGASYFEFKESLWPRVITKRSPQREQFFIRLAEERANTGRFFVIPDTNYSNEKVEEVLVSEGIISYEPNRGYFITHDIYEEWALEKFVESGFLSSENSEIFFDKIQQSLPIRRVFRRWLSEKLSSESEEVSHLIVETLSSSNIAKLWKDEVLVSMLLSDYSDYFFNISENLLLEDDFSLLKRICLLIRIGCKEIDNSFFDRIGVRAPDILSMDYVMTRPKGTGWKSLIKFIYENIENIGVENLNFVLPVLYDWSSNNKSGETTKYASLISLSFYKLVIVKDIYIGDDGFSKNLILTILYGASEIKSELEAIIDEVTLNNWKGHNDPYYLLSEFILTKMECFNVAMEIPEKVITLAKCFWTHEPPENGGYYYSSRLEIDHEFGVENRHQDFYPASAYQTPIYALLKTDLKLTLNFITGLLNSSSRIYAESSLDEGQVETTTLFLDDGKKTNLPVSNRLWCMYRGTQVSPHLLESILMSLERFFLERGKSTKSETLEYYLNYILEKAESSALVAVVASIVCAFHEKTFNVAKTLFRTKEFFFYDSARMIIDQTHKNQLISLKNFSVNRTNELHENERIRACDQKHRKHSLEDIALQYQFFRTEEVSDEESENRVQEIWKILDHHYRSLPSKEHENHKDKTWRLYLARMDKRKMSPKAKEIEHGIAIEFNPEIEPDLKEYSEASQREANGPFKHLALNNWADSRLYNRDNYNKYESYENDPLTALGEAKEIWNHLSGGSMSVGLQLDRATPSYVCAVLLRDFKEKLGKAELEFCKEVIFDYASIVNNDDYIHQIGDGLVPALFVLPRLIGDFADERLTVKLVLIRALMRHDSISMMGMDRISSVAIQSVQHLWKDEPEFMKSLYIGYLIIAQKYRNVQDRLRQEAYKAKKYDIDENDFEQEFFKELENVAKSIEDETIEESAIKNIESIDNDILITAFQLLPLDNKLNSSVPFVEEIIKIISQQLLSRDRENRLDYAFRYEFLKYYARFVLHLDNSKKDRYLKYFTDDFTLSEGTADLLNEFVSAEDSLNMPDSFWYVWNRFKGCVVDSISSQGWRHDKERIIESFLFARVPWKDDAMAWHTFSPENKVFFNDLSSKIGSEPSFIYSISKLLCGIGSEFLDDGIYWISNAIKTFDIDLSQDKSGNTLFYLERYMRRYLFKNHDRVRQTPNLKAQAMVVLDFLVEKYSITGYLLREDIA
ncbi:AVAST type 4 anti-phage nuclease Avs4 [Photobacterium alginatilyticum]|uniref:AVAST type 4 anti-phage nuclease Avs4 n=1 Tax=Photobacterium alginatilyticum TaxID=1775171 RepID=UPI0018657BB0|nr:AVAST type 4 anti-phage nuclease Avs4 [Photobacterium alginatilyticum]